MSKNISEVLQSKFGLEITNTAVIDGQIVSSNLYNKKEFLFNSANKQIENYIADGIILPETNKKVLSKVNNNWGFDFPGWLGTISEGKKIMIIGQEPHILEPPVQIVYGFCQNLNESSQEAAQRLIKSNKLWYRVAELFKHQFIDKHDVLENCYITDICHFAPSKCGTVGVIETKIFEHSQKWKTIRDKILSKYLEDEVHALSPSVILCQSAIAYESVIRVLSPQVRKAERMKYPSKGYMIKFAKWEDRVNIIGIPHLGSNFNITNKFWDNHLPDVLGLIKRYVDIKTI
jgi:hypothetical protein